MSIRWLYTPYLLLTPHPQLFLPSTFFLLNAVLAAVSASFRFIQQSNGHTDEQTWTHKQVESDTDLCDLCRGRHPWSQDGRAVICSPWWLEDEAQVTEGKRGRKEGWEEEEADVPEEQGRSEEVRRGGRTRVDAS